MAEAPGAARERLLDPVSRISEILFGLIMALTFTATIDVASDGNEDVRLLLVGTIGCNIAWGLVDAVMFLIATLSERGHNLVMVRGVRAASGAPEAHGIIADSLPPLVARLLTADDFERLRQGVLAIPSIPERPSLVKEDWLKAVAVFMLVFLSTFPVVIPFMLIGELQTALRTSNAVAIAMMFASGYLLARYGGYRPWLTGASMVVLGVALVGIAIALGG